MSAPVSYFDVIRKMPNAFDYRFRLVTHARQHGIKATARAFATTVSTKRKWLRRSLDLCLLPPVFLDYHLNDQGG